MWTLSSNIVKLEVASVHEVEQALARQGLYGGDLPTNLLELASVSEDRLTSVIAESVGLEPAPSGELPRAPDRVRRLVPGELAQRYSLYPLDDADARLVVAVSEPLPPEVVSDLEFSLGLPLVQRATTLVRVHQAIARDYELALDQRIARVLARLAGEPDPHPSIPVEAAAPAAPSSSQTARPPATESSVSSAPPVEPHRSLPPGERVTSAPPAEWVAHARVTSAPPPERPAGTERPATSTNSPPPDAPRTESVPPHARPNLDVLAFARAERRGPRQPRRLGPYTIAMAEDDLLEAQTRDEVVATFFDFAAQYFEYSALFAVHGDLAEGRDAHGAGAPRARVLAIGVPLELPSTLAQVAATEPYRLARLSASGIDGALAKDLQRRPGPAVLLLPIRVRDRAVLVLYGDHGDSDVALESVGDVISFAPLAAAAFERVIRRRKEKAHGKPPRNEVQLRPDPTRVRRTDASRRGERASALASFVESSSFSRPPPEPTPRGPSVRTPALSSPPLARPVISIGPGGRGSSASLPALPRTQAFSESAYGSISATPGPVSVRPLPSTNPTPIPSSFAPGAPPHAPARSIPVTAPLEVPSPAADDGWDDGEPDTKPGVGSLPPEHRSFSTPEALAPEEIEELVPGDEAAAAEPGDQSPELAIAAVTFDEPEIWSDEDPIDEGAPVAPRSRSLAHSARPLPPPGSSIELRLPAVIVDLAQDTEALVARLIHGDQTAADRLVQVGAAAVPALVGAFPGPLTAELRRGVGDGPARASECGPLLRVLAKIGPKAAGVLSVRSNDQDPEIRAWATRLLGEMPCPDAARAVARRFIDQDAEVRRAALAAGRMLTVHPSSGPLLAGALSEMLLDSNRRDRLQHLVIEGIADLREARAVPALATLLAAGSPEIQTSAHWALVVLARTDYGDNAAAWDEWWRVNASRHRIEWLIDALMHESQEIRRAAGDELKSLTKEYFGYYDDLPPRERERAQKRYRDWWDSKGKARFT